VLSGGYDDLSAHDPKTVNGFWGRPKELVGHDRGFSLQDSELSATARIDPYFAGTFTAHFHEEDMGGAYRGNSPQPASHPAGDPQGQADYAAHAAAFSKAMQTAMQRWQEQAQPLAGTPVLQYHKRYIYLIDWLGMQDAGTLEPKPGVPPAARRWRWPSCWAGRSAGGAMWQKH
jgi:hypothetical protein